MAREAFPEDIERGKRLRRLREEVEYADLAAAAKGAGVSVGGLRKWEKGGEVERKSVYALIRFYGANPRWVMEGKEPMLRPDDDFLARLSGLEGQVLAQGRLLALLADQMEVEDAEGMLQDVNAAAQVPEIDAPKRDDRQPPTGT